MEDSEKRLFNREFLDKWYSNYHKLEAFHKQKGAITGELDEELARWADIQRSIKHMLPGEMRNKLPTLNFDFEDKGSSWESMYKQLARFAQKNGPTYPLIKSMKCSKTG